MDLRDDLASILPFLPVILRSSSIFWPPKVFESIKALSLGPDVSRVDSGEVFFDAILDLRVSLGISGERLAYKAAEGYALFFDELMDRVDARAWFGEVVPMLARMLLRLPSMLEDHYNGVDGVFEGKSAGLRILGHQEAGIVFLSQELAATLLVCSLLCIFPTNGRGVKRLPSINFDHLFAGLIPDGNQSQQEKLKCLVHYFERISSCTPLGFVSFERKVLPMRHGSWSISYPEAGFWEKSIVPLCPFQVNCLGLIENQKYEVLEVDFANEYLGGGALHRGCVQEEIRFMINPELIVGMLFLPSMGDNEAIEIVGIERFSYYEGYSSSFHFEGDYHDKKPLDSLGRRQTRITAIDALCSSGVQQFGVSCLLRETNKAFCGFFSQEKHQDYLKILQDSFPRGSHFPQVSSDCRKPEFLSFSDSKNSKTIQMDSILSSVGGPSQSNVPHSQSNSVGVATGNWGCGAFGGDPQLKSMIQWLAASQALRPFILYYTFGHEALQRLEQVTQWILLHEWTVGDLWSMLVEYSSLRLNGKTRMGFLNWLLPNNYDKTTANADYME